MIHIIGTHEVADRARWLASPKRAEIFGAMGIKTHTFIDAVAPNKCGILFEIPDDKLEAFKIFMASPAGKAVSEGDGVYLNTLQVFIPS